MKLSLAFLPAALLAAGMAHADFYINDYDAMLTGTPESDNTVELRDFQEPKSLPDDFVVSLDYWYLGTPDDDGTHALRDYVPKRSLPLDFVPSVDLQIVGTPDDDGSVSIRPNGKPCPLSAAKTGIC